MSFESLLTSAVTVQRKLTSVKDASGGQITPFSNVPGLTSLPAMVQTRTGDAVRQLGQKQVLITHAIYLSTAEGVRRGDVVYEPSTQRTFLVHFFGPMGGQVGPWRLDCTLVEG